MASSSKMCEEEAVVGSAAAAKTSGAAKDVMKKKKKKKRKEAEGAKAEEEEERKTKKKKRKTEEAAASEGKKTESYFSKHAIAVEGGSVVPVTRFEEAPFCGAAVALLASTYEAPTATQAVSWPLAAGGRDVISVAKTGSGKTLGFLLPVFAKMEPRKVTGPCAPQAVALAPTRELASQIGQEAAKFARCFEARSVTVYGGAPKWEQARLLKTLGGRGLVVGTPGRVKDFLDGRKLCMDALESFVLDEADRMLDMGFEPQIREIRAYVSRPVQTLLFTATWDARVQRTAAFLTRPNALARVVFGDAADGKLAANKDITQTVEVVDEGDKKRRTVEFLESERAGGKAIVFVATKKGCDRLCRELRRVASCEALHGDRDQADRTRIIDAFKRSKLDILVATDVAARGLDVADVALVLQVDFPAAVADYVHRVGRTGRAGNKGRAHAFLTANDAHHVPALRQILADAGQTVPPDLHALRPPRRGSAAFRPRRAMGRAFAR